MSKRLLVRYIRLAVKEAHLARVPNQLLTTDEEPNEEAEDEDSVQEFSGVGGIAGYTVPLGMDPDKLGRKKNSRGK